MALQFSYATFQRKIQVVQLNLNLFPGGRYRLEEIRDATETVLDGQSVGIEGLFFGIWSDQPKI